MKRPYAARNFNVTADQIGGNFIPLVEKNRINIGQRKLSKNRLGYGHCDMLPC